MLDGNAKYTYFFIKKLNQNVEHQVFFFLVTEMILKFFGATLVNIHAYDLTRRDELEKTKIK